ncbi:AAA family ATPase [Ensifer adhaerens]|uniref:AAA family ATPase n=1 Tax=Ensifer adhaerens TaxID=106592 RepID=UPI000CF0A505|nr:AAA family ATPase [Ensifer adhaerens]
MSSSAAQRKHATLQEHFTAGDFDGIASVYYGIYDRILDWERANPNVVVAPAAEDGSGDWERADPTNLEQPSSDSGPADMTEARRWAILVDNIDGCDANTSMLLWLDPATGHPSMAQIAGPEVDAEIAMRIIGRDIGAAPPPKEYKPSPLAESLTRLAEKMNPPPAANDNEPPTARPDVKERLIRLQKEHGGEIIGESIFGATIDSKTGRVSFGADGVAILHTLKGSWAVQETPQLRATPFALRNSTAIPQREWLHALHYMRRYLSVTVGAGGGGKSAHAVSEALAMVTGRPLLDPDGPLCRPLRVWYVNAEDPADEIERRFTAAAMHFNVTAEQIGDRLFTDSGREQEFVIVRQEGRDFKVREPMVDDMLSVIRENAIDVVIVDPFVSTHEVPENDNGLIQRVAKAWRRIADEGNCSVELIHHVTKGNLEITADSARGGGALKDAARSVRTINAMTKDEGERAGLEDACGYFRVDFGKVNMVPASAGSKWRRFVSVPLNNGKGLTNRGDEIGVVESWYWPSRDIVAKRAAEERASLVADVPTETLAGLKARLGAGDFKASDQANNWAGQLVGEFFDLDVRDKDSKRQVKAMLAAWIDAGELEIVQIQDSYRRVSPHIKPVAALPK